ncbi:MAG: hypothetical protein P8X48_03260 [Acidiferrobacteraceae bacterium]
MIPVSLLLPMAWRNIWRNKRRTLLTILALGIGVWSMIVLAALMDAWGQSTFDATVRNLTGHGQIHAKGYLDDPGAGQLPGRPRRHRPRARTWPVIHCQCRS